MSLSDRPIHVHEYQGVHYSKSVSVIAPLFCNIGPRMGLMYWPIEYHLNLLTTQMCPEMSKPIWKKIHIRRPY